MTGLWEEIGLLGRDSLLKNVILPRANSLSQQFVLLGEAGTGKTAILEWAASHTKQKYALVSASMTFSIILDSIISQWEIDCEGKSKMKAEEKKILILQQSGNVLYVDDLHRSPPKLIQFLRVISETNRFCGALTVGRLKEELKQILWSSENIMIRRLPPKKAKLLARKMCTHFGSMAPPSSVANISDGYPARIAGAAKTGDIPRYDRERAKGQEIDLAPVILILCACLAVFRYLGRAVGATDFVLLGGLGMVGMIFASKFIGHGKIK